MRNNAKATQLELRSVDVCPEEVEIREREDGGVTLSGYAAVFDQETVLWDSFREVVRRGAFGRAIREQQDTVCEWAHGRGGDLPLARVKAKTLRLSEDDKGLRYEADLPDTQIARDLVTSIKAGNVRGSSFSFRVQKETWTEAKGVMPLRELIDLDLFDVSPVTRPQYEGTSVGVRSAADVFEDWIQSRDGQEPEPKDAQLERSEQELAFAQAEQDQFEVECMLHQSHQDKE